MLVAMVVADVLLRADQYSSLSAPLQYYKTQGKKDSAVTSRQACQELLVEGNMQSPDDIEKAQAITFNTVHVPAFEPASTAPSSFAKESSLVSRELGAVLAGSKART